MSYNGWTNYETWCVALWLDNDQSNYYGVRYMIEEVRGSTESMYEIADAVKVFVEELPEMLAVTEGPASFVCDLLGAAMSEVSWREIAENLLSEVDA